MKGRILCKLSSEAEKLKRQRRKDIKAEGDDLVSSFLAATEGSCPSGTDDLLVASPTTACGALAQKADDEQSDVDLWTNLPTRANLDRAHVHEIPTQACRKYLGRLVRSRADALKAAMPHGKDSANPHG